MQVGVDSFREAFLQGLLGGDPRAAEIAARDAIDAGLDELSISEHVIAPALRAVWDMWERGLISEADEKEATKISVRVLALQREAFRRALQRGGEGVVLAELEGDVPTPRLVAAAHALAGAGFRVHCLARGASILSLGPDGRPGTAARRGPVVTSREVGETLGYALEEIELAAEGTKIVVGGPGVPSDLSQTEDRLTWESPGEIVRTVDALVLRPALN